MTDKYTNDQLRQAVAAFTSHDTDVLAAASLGICDTTLRRQVKAAALKGLLDPGSAEWCAVVAASYERDRHTRTTSIGIQKCRRKL